MAKNDYFAITYRILAYLYECLKAGEDPHLEEILAETLGIPERYWSDIITELYEKGYIQGVREVHAPWTSETIYAFDKPKISMDGVAFLQDNHSIAKAKEALKDIKAIIPGL